MHNFITFEKALEQSANSHRHLLLGNGFSIDCRKDVFSYGALFDSAEFDSLSPFAKKAFKTLGTTDFERVMKALDDASVLANLYQSSKTKLAETFKTDAAGLREVLVQTIAKRHPDLLSEIKQEEYAYCKRFLSNFKDIYTLNYDLLLYWTLMQTEIDPKIRSDDGFRTPDDGPEDYVSWDIEKTNNQNIFYMHGALHIFDAKSEIKKFTWSNTGIPLTAQIRSALEEKMYPLIVAEGECEQKLEKIMHSNYLSRAYRSFSQIRGALFIFGHSAAENDDHILRLISKNKVKEIFVSLFGGLKSKTNKEIIATMERYAQHKGNQIPLHFYDAESAHVWR